MILVTLLYFSGITLTNTNSTAKASSEEDYYLDTNYIYDITYNLSNIINTLYGEGEIAKGRAYGSEGEQFAATDIIAPQMEALGLYDPIADPTLPSYLEKIENITDEDAKKVIENITGSGNITNITDVTAMGLILNHSGNKTPIDCYIT